MDKKKVYRAGVIPYYIKEDEIQMLFMQPSEKKFGGAKFQVAKGRREEGESDETTAFREANEELGLFAGNILKRYDLGTFLGRTRVYVAEIEDPKLFGDPDNETGAVKWMTLKEFQKEGRDLHKPVVKAACRWIESQQE